MTRYNCSHRVTERPFPKIFAAACVLALSMSAATPAAAQRTSVAGGLFLSLGGGVTFGPGELWSLQRQPLRNPNLTANPGDPPFVDTLLVDQSVEPGSSFLLSLTGYPSASFGVGLDIGYHGFRSSRNCRVVFDSAFDDRLNVNPQDAITSPNISSCADVRAKSHDATTLDLMPFVAWRLLPNKEITPMVKVGAGLGLVPCTVRVNSPLRDLINGECAGSARPMWGGSIGFYRQTDVEIQFHFEFRYSVHQWGTITGPADINGIAPVGKIWRGGLGFSMGVDFEV